MNKIQKNLTAIEQKFLSLKATHQLYEQPTPIGQVAQVMTYGVIRQTEVQEYLAYVHSSPQIELKQKINQKWYEQNTEQMILFLDKVIQFRNINKSKESPNKEKLNLSPKKKKTKKLNSDAHQNPYIPHKINGSIKNYTEQPRNQFQENNNQNIRNQNNNLQNKDELQFQQSQNLSPQINKQETQQIAFGLPSDFQSLPVKQRYAILSRKYGKDKSILQKKFDSIYKHYRKEMFIPYESFQINNQLLMDMRIFLKYYREFDISKRFRTNQAMKYFKKIALNGLWLDDKKFFDIHYKLIEILDIEQKDFNQQMQNSDPIDIQRANQLKKQLSKNIKILVQNIVKIKQLSELVSDDKINNVFNNNTNKNIIKKIVQAHSGLIKEDVILKLQERVQDRKNRKNFLLGNFNLQKFGQSSPSKNISPSKLLDKTQKLSPPHKLSIYQELQIPNLRSREMKKSSIYTALDVLKIHKEKQKLKQLIDQTDNQQYLQAYFRKQKQLYTMPRSNSVTILRTPTQNEESGINFSVKSTRSIKNNFKKQNIFQRNFSLPRMKFT